MRLTLNGLGNRDDVRPPVFLADKREYHRAGFFPLEHADGSVTIIPTALPDPEPDTSPQMGSAFDPADYLFIQCALNIGFWGPAGSVLVDPSEDGFVFHVPNRHSTRATMTLNPSGRVLRAFAGWTVDVVYWLDRSSTRLVPRELTQVFKEKSERDRLVIERKLRHEFQPYRHPYQVTFSQDGSVTLRLGQRRIEKVGRFIAWVLRWLPKEVSITMGKLEWTAISITWKR